MAGYGSVAWEKKGEEERKTEVYIFTELLESSWRKDQRQSFLSTNRPVLMHYIILGPQSPAPRYGLRLHQLLNRQLCKGYPVFF